MAAVIASRGERADSSTTEGARKRRVHRTKEERAAQKSDREAIERERNAEFTMAFLRLQELEGAIEAGDDEAMNQWLEIATGLVDSFRSTKQLFPSDPRKRFTGMIRTHRRKGKRDLEAEADQLADRLQRSISACSDITKCRSRADGSTLQSPKRTTRWKRRVSAVSTLTAGSTSSCACVSVKVRSLEKRLTFSPRAVLLHARQDRRHRARRRGPASCPRGWRLPPVRDPPGVAASGSHR